MRQIWSKVSSCRRSAADCSCGILVCGKSAAKFIPAADLPQTVPVAYWYAASLQQNFFLPHTSAYSLPQTKSLRQVCGRSAAGLRHTFHFPMGAYEIYSRFGTTVGFITKQEHKDFVCIFQTNGLRSSCLKSLGSVKGNKILYFVI